MDPEGIKSLLKSCNYIELETLKSLVTDELNARENTNQYRVYHAAFRNRLSEKFLIAEIDRALPPWHMTRKQDRKKFIVAWQSCIEKLTGIGLSPCPGLEILIINLIGETHKKAPTLIQICSGLENILTLFDDQFPRYRIDPAWIALLNDTLKSQSL